MSSLIRGAATACALAATLVGCIDKAEATTAIPPLLTFLGEATIATGTQFAGTEVGGLSGIDYDAGNNLYYAISDDRSTINPARFYTLKIDLADGALTDGDVSLQSVVTLLDQSGLPFTPGAVDPEAIRFNSTRASVFWTSEGDANALLPPFVREATLGGAFLRELQTPATYFPTSTQTSGIRNNLAFESLSFTPGRARITTATENALYQDGPAATLTDASPSRILEFGVHRGVPLQSFIYNTEKVAEASEPATSFSTNGLVEMLAFARNKYLTIERSFSTGRGNVIRVYVIDTSDATNVSSLDSIAGVAITPVRKTLIADFADYGIIPDNIEGVTFGPTLANGRRTLIFVADNNFAASQKTQFLAFSFKPGALFSAVK